MCHCDVFKNWVEDNKVDRSTNYNYFAVYLSLNPCWVEATVDETNLLGYKILVYGPMSSPKSLTPFFLPFSRLLILLY